MKKTQKQLRRKVRFVNMAVDIILSPFKLVCLLISPLAYLLGVGKGIVLLALGKL